MLHGQDDDEIVIKYKQFISQHPQASEDLDDLFDESFLDEDDELYPSADAIGLCKLSLSHLCAEKPGDRLTASEVLQRLQCFTEQECGTTDSPECRKCFVNNRASFVIKRGWVHLYCM